MSELHDRLNMMAERGQPRGADAVIAAAMADAENDNVDMVDPISLDDERPKRRNGKSVFAAGGIAALLGVATLAISALVGSSGAESPEAAVRQLADAISNEDPVAAVDVISPDEARLMKEALDTATSKAQELEVIESAGEPFAGIDLTVDGLDLDTETLAPGYAKVTINDANLRIKTDNEAFSELVKEAIPDGQPNVDESFSLAEARAEAAEYGDVSDDEVFVVAIERDGAWYVSTAYTIMEYAREAADAPPADYGSAMASMAELGADSPEAAVDEMFAAVSTGDWKQMLALLPPDEVPVYDYRAWLLEEMNSEDQPDITVNDLETSAEIDGDRAVVTVSGSITDNETGDTVVMAEDCAVTFYYADSADADDDAEQCFGLRAYLDHYTGAAAGGHNIQVVAVERNGRWFLSPVGTMVDVLTDGIDAIDRDLIYAWVGLGYLAEPEMTITFGEEITARGGPRVFAIEGKAGQEIVGQILDDENSWNWMSASLYLPDGTRHEDDYGLFDYDPVELPVDGTYTLVVWETSLDPYVIWDASSAPEEALEEPYYSQTNIDLDAPVDEVLVLGTPSQPVVTNWDDAVDRVYTFEGVAGQEIVGFASDNASVSYDVIGPDGEYIEDQYGLFYGESMTLPASGTYRLHVTVYGSEEEDTEVTITLYDALTAPAEVLDPYGSDAYADEIVMGDDCHIDDTGDGDTVEVCESVTTPTIAEATPLFPEDDPTIDE